METAEIGNPLEYAISKALEETSAKSVREYDDERLDRYFDAIDAFNSVSDTFLTEEQDEKILESLFPDDKDREFVCQERNNPDRLLDH